MTSKILDTKCKWKDCDRHIHQGAFISICPTHWPEAVAELANGWIPEGEPVEEKETQEETPLLI